MKRGPEAAISTPETERIKRAAKDLSPTELRGLIDFIKEQAIVKEQATRADRCDQLAAKLREKVMSIAHLPEALPTIVWAAVSGNFIHAELENGWSIHLAPCEIKVYTGHISNKAAVVYRAQEDLPEGTLKFMEEESAGAPVDPLGLSGAEFTATCRVAKALWFTARDLYEGSEDRRWYGGPFDK